MQASEHIHGILKVICELSGMPLGHCLDAMQMEILDYARFCDAAHLLTAPYLHLRIHRSQVMHSFLDELL